MSLKTTIFNHIKNIPGWKTKRKLLAIVVDDYGNVRVDSKKALEKISDKTLNNTSRFDIYDTLETREDLEMLFEVLISVKDRSKNPAVFTPYALSCNIDFERMKEEGYMVYRYELLPVTFNKLSHIQTKAYEGAWQLWKEGIKHGLMRPEFHGREHLNIKIFEEKLITKDSALMVSLENRSLANFGSSIYSSMEWQAAFSFWDPVADTKNFNKIMKDGLCSFEKVYGYKAQSFTPPARHFPEFLENKLKIWGLMAFDRPFLQKKHMGFGKYKIALSTMGWHKEKNMVDLVRNVVFEPTYSNIDHVGMALKQIEAAFSWDKPAIVSSHRVNFCGHIDPKNRQKGLEDLSKLLKAIIKKWPEVEFVSVAELIGLISNKNY